MGGGNETDLEGARSEVDRPFEHAAKKARIAGRVGGFDLLIVLWCGRSTGLPAGAVMPSRRSLS